MSGILFGLAFTIIVTRQLEPQEFGIWAIIGRMLGYSIITEVIISYWSVRQIARNEPIGKTSIISSSLFSVGSIPIYVICVYLFSDVNDAFFSSMLLATILIPVMFIRGTLHSINFGHMPHATSIGIAVFQLLKIPCSLGLVFFLDLGLNGVIIAIFIAYLGEIAVQLRYAIPKLSVSLNFSYLKNWIKQSWIPMYATISNVMAILDVIIFTIITGSIIGVAYYAAAAVVANLVARTGSIHKALYPKLLASGSREHINENFILILYFAIPLLFITIIFPKHILFVLNSEYAHMGMAVTFLSLHAFFYMITTFFNRTLLGIEDVDVEKRPSPSQLFRSKLFLISSISNIRHVLYIGTLATLLYAFQDLSDTELVNMWSMIALAFSIPFLIYSGILVRRYAILPTPYVPILKYLIGGISIAITFVFTNEYVVVFESNIYSYLPNLILELMLCCVVYVGVTYAIDRKTRNLFKLVALETLSRWKK